MRNESTVVKDDVTNDDVTNDCTILVIVSIIATIISTSLYIWVGYDLLSVTDIWKIVLYTVSTSAMVVVGYLGSERLMRSKKSFSRIAIYRIIMAIGTVIQIVVLSFILYHVVIFAITTYVKV